MNAPVQTEPRKVNDRVVDALARALAAAKRGELVAAAIITVDQAGSPAIAFGGAGGATMAAYFGAGMLQQQLMVQASGPVSSPIVRAGQLPEGLIKQ